jgi:ABC-type nickel/cobalt efflux system permease component RcnA
VWLSLAAIGLAVVCFIPRSAWAHPMGNFSISHFSGIHLAPGAVEIRYILDMAEIPTFQELQATGIVTDPHDPRVTAYLAQKADTLKTGLTVTLDGHSLALETVSEDVIFPPGAGGLPTMKIGVVYRARFSGDVCAAGFCALDYADRNLPDRAGWKEIVVAADPGVTMQSSTAPATSRSRELANYPTDLISSPPQDLSARLTFATAAGLPVGAHLETAADGSAGGLPPKPSSARAATGNAITIRRAKSVTASTPARAGSSAASTRAAAPVAGPAVSATQAASESISTDTASGAAAGLALKGNAQGTPRNRFTELIASNQWGLWFLLTAALIAAALGGLHALEPGHGKTIVAAYLVGSQGTAAHALWLGLIVTVTHTAGVYALGLITLYASKYIVPDHLYPWLGVISGLTIAALGLYMLRRRYAGHAHGHSHSHGGHHDHHGWLSHSHTGEDVQHDHADHDHGHSHHHHDHTHHDHHQHQHDEHHHVHGPAKPFSYRQLIALGVTGGIVPCPAALVVLLSAVSLHRVAFGLYLILAFSLGLAAVLISIGLVTVYARRLLARVPTEGPVINRWLPMASAAVITCLGLALVFQGLLSMGVVHFRL